MLKTKLLLLLLPFPALALAQAAAPASAFDPRYNEAMAVCDNMGMYVDMAQRQLKMGMPQATATDLVTKSMETNYKMDGELKKGAISLVRVIYADVYATPSRTESVDVVLGKTCGSYRGYNVPRQQVEQHLAGTVQSAWDPLARVPRCTKLAQSAANIGTARDRGMAREKMSEVATGALRDDTFTLPQVPRMVSDAYDHADAEVTFLYVYNLGYCKATAEGQHYPALTALMPEYAKCKAGTGPAEDKGSACLKRVFGVDPKA
jgi:hypothetical protein